MRSIFLLPELTAASNIFSASSRYINASLYYSFSILITAVSLNSFNLFLNASMHMINGYLNFDKFDRFTRVIRRQPWLVILMSDLNLGFMRDCCGVRISCFYCYHSFYYNYGLLDYGRSIVFYVFIRYDGRCALKIDIQ